MEMSLSEVFENQLVDFPEDEFTKKWLKGIFYFSHGKERIKDLVETMKMKLWEKHSMDDLLSACGLKKEEAQQFLEEFTAEVGVLTGERERQLLEEAALLLGGTDSLESAARKYGKNYPELFADCCMRLYEEQKWERCVQLAWQAVLILDKKLVMRGRAAATGAKAANRLGDIGKERAFREEAFWSEATVENLLRMLCGSYNDSEYKALLEKMDIHVYNTLGKDGRPLNAILNFFLQDVKNSMEYCEKKTDYLGWSEKPQGVLVPLFLICMTKKAYMTKAMRAVVSRISGRCSFAGQTEELWELLVCWRGRHFQVDEDSCLHWLEAQIRGRTEAVVGGGFRSSYRKAAELVVVLDEIYAEKGLRYGGAFREEIRSLHSRKSAFARDLKSLL